MFVTDVTSAALAASMFLLYNGRRFYENLYVNIFSHRQSVNPLELLLDVAFVVGAGLSLIAEVDTQGTCRQGSLVVEVVLAVFMYISNPASVCPSVRISVRPSLRDYHRL